MGGVRAVVAFVRPKLGRALRGRRNEITHHHPFLVGIGHGNDLDRRDRRCRDLQSRLRFRRRRLNPSRNRAMRNYLEAQ